MPKKALASLNVVINAVTSPLFRGLAKASKRLMAFGTKMKAVGRSISMSFSLPFAAIGVAGAKMAIDFEKNMTKINTLVGISGKEVNAFAKDVMKLSGETAQAPAELAEGLFFLTSAGLRGANAMETLNAVAKGTAIGLGEQADLAKVAAAAQNAYGKENLSAAKALDIFGGAVREGMFEASDLAAVLGTQLGMAASLGISFEETNAFIATYTKTTGDANAATTSFGGVMMALAKTTPKMEKALAEIGMTGDSVREMLGERGLRATLIHLKDSFEDNNIPLTEFFSKSQALKGVLGVLGNQTETYGEVLDGMGTSVGMVSDGFDTLSETSGFKMQKAFNNLKNAATELGAMLMPVFTKIVGFFTKLAKSFQQLDSSRKKLIVAAAALVAFSGPLMTLGGGLVTVLGAVLTPVGLVVAALGALFAIIYNNWGTTKKILVGIINYFITLYNESTLFRALIQGLVFVFKTALQAGIVFGKNMVTIFTAVKDAALNILGGIGEIILGIFTFKPDKIREGFKKATSGFVDIVMDTFEGIQENVEEFGKKTAENFQKGIENTQNARPLVLITEDDIQAGVDDVGKWMADKLAAVKKKLQGFIGGGILGVPEGGGGDPKGGGLSVDWNAGPSHAESGIDALDSKQKGFFDKSSEEWAEWGQKVGETWNQISQVAGTIINGIGNLWEAQHQKELTIIDNGQIAEEEAMNKEFNRQAAIIENSAFSQEKKDEKLLDLKTKFETTQGDIDTKFDGQRKALMQKQARRDKAMKIANAIMSTAQGIAAALPIIPLAVMVGAMGAAQVAAIASTPIPMAKGGLAFGPTNAIVGDNPGAANDPEVIAPLSQLKSMLFDNMNLQLDVGGVIKGEDIFLSNETTDEARTRYI